MEKSDNFISAKQISTIFHLSYPTVNHYTNLGFFSVSKRKGNQRLYTESEVRKQLERIYKLKDEGYPLRLIVKMLRK
ncbi:MAG: MerR family transcriptional regulator [Candidatus Omnitrophota bacterium]|nr:MAG: MerR family transcriptional regulator [Candidatus Omnitrophota bacterium]